MRKKTIISHITNEMNFDHLSLFDAGNKNFTHIMRVMEGLREKRQPVFPFSDEMYVFN